CSTLMARLQRATERGLATLTQSPSPSSIAVRTPPCLSPETIVAYVERVLPTDDNDIAERHLQTCNACFNEVQTALRATSFLAAPGKTTVPTTLKAQAATLWQQAKV